MCAPVFFIQSQFRRPNLKSVFALLITGIGLSLIVYFAFLQTIVNKGWHTLWADAKLAVQIDRYPHWQNPSQMGHLKRDDGQIVYPNTYERVAWATAGSRAMIAYPQGVDVLAYPSTKHPDRLTKMVAGPNAHGIATRSGWVELGLAFGIPILGLIFSALLFTPIQRA